MRDLTELKITNSHKTVGQSDDYSWLETEIGLKLPSLYRRFLIEFNGGCPELSTYSNTEGEWGVDRFFFVEDKEELEPSEYSLLWNFRNKWPGAKTSFLPVGEDGGGNPISLDLEYGGDSPVFYWTHDPPDFEVVVIAPSFEEFIDGLHIHPDYI